MQKIQILILLIMCTALAAEEGRCQAGVTAKGGSGVTIRSEKRDGQKVLIMENRLVRIVLTPGRGAHITEFTLKKTGRNILYNGHNQWEGYTDILDKEHPGPEIQTKPFLVSMKQTDARGTITCSYACGEVLLERMMSLDANASVLEIVVRLTNKGTAARALSYGAHACIMVGGTADYQDFLIWPDGQDIKRRVEGAPYNVVESFETPPMWIALLDTQKKDLVVERFSPDGIHHFLIWKSFYCPIPQAYWDWDNVPPGESREARCFLGMAQGVADLCTVGENCAADIKVDRPQYGQNDEVNVEYAFCGWRSRPPRSAEVRIRALPDKRVVWSSQVNLGAVPAGGACRESCPWRTGGAADGDYIAELEDGDLHVATTFRINGKIMNPVIQLMPECQKKLKEEKMEKGMHERAELLLRDAQASLQAGLHDRAGEQLAQVRNLFQKEIP